MKSQIINLLRNLSNILFPFSYQTNQGEDIKRLKEFLKKHNPHAVVIGAQSSKAKKFYREFSVIRDRLSEEWPDCRNMSIFYGDTRVPRLHESSKMSRNEFPSVIFNFTQTLKNYNQNKSFNKLCSIIKLWIIFISFFFGILMSKSVSACAIVSNQKKLNGGLFNHQKMKISSNIFLIN